MHKSEKCDIYSEHKLVFAQEIGEFSVKQDAKKFLRRVQLKAFIHDKEDDSNTSDKDSDLKIELASPRGPVRLCSFFLSLNAV